MHRSSALDGEVPGEPAANLDASSRLKRRLSCCIYLFGSPRRAHYAIQKKLAESVLSFIPPFGQGRSCNIVRCRSRISIVKLKLCRCNDHQKRRYSRSLVHFLRQDRLTLANVHAPHYDALRSYGLFDCGQLTDQVPTEHCSESN